MSGIAGFDEWYAEKQKALKSDTNARFFHNARTESQHIGINPVNRCSSGTDSNGKRVVKYYFSHDFADTARVVPETDVASACREYMRSIVRIILECYLAFGSVIDSAQYYTLENIAKLGLTIEDVEESLGFPRGWTKGIPDEARIQGLGRGLEPDIDWLFEKHLKLNRFGRKST